MVSDNPLRATFDEDGVVFGADARTFSPAVIELFGGIGYDYVWLDYEHAGPSPFDAGHVETHARAAAASGVEPLIRVPSAEPKVIGTVLDAGIRTIIIPQVESAEAVERAVAAAHYPGAGRPGTRGVGPSRSNQWGTSLEGYTDRQNADVLVGAMIETAAAVDAIEEIVAVSNLGFLFIGPADLSLSMTDVLNPADPVVTETIESVLSAAASADVPVGRSFPSVSDARTALDQGYQMITLGRDLSAVYETFDDRLSALR